MTPPAPRLRLPLAADAAALEPARQSMDDHLCRSGVDARTVYRCEVVLEEVLLNIVRHGLTARTDGVVDFCVAVDTQSVTLSFVDTGPPFDPTGLPPPPAPTSLATAPVGGLGVLLVRRLSQRMVYSRERGCNRLVVTVARDAGDCAVAG